MRQQVRSYQNFCVEDLESITIILIDNDSNQS